MRIIDIISTASSNMFRSKLRTSLTIIAIFIGAFTLTLTNGLGAGISKYIDEQVGNLGAEDVLIIMPADGGSTGLPSDTVKKYDPDKQTQSLESQGNRTVTVMTEKDIVRITKISGIKSAEPYVGASIDYVSTGSSDKFVASVEAYLNGANYTLDAGRLTDNSAADYQVMLPSAYVEPLGLGSAEAAIGKTLNFGITNALGQSATVKGEIVGVKQKSLAEGSAITVNTALLTELRRVQSVGQPPSVNATFLYATARFDPSITDSELAALKDRLKSAGYSAMTVEDQIGTFKAVIAGIVAVLNGFAAIALLAASFGIINTLLMSVQERTKEIGLMKAMGMSSTRIFLLFSTEAVMLGFWGSLLGSVVAIGVASVVNQYAADTFLKDLEGLRLMAFTPASVATIIGIVMLIAFLAGSLPALRAARKSPIDALRYE